MNYIQIAVTFAAGLIIGLCWGFVVGKYSWITSLKKFICNPELMKILGYSLVDKDKKTDPPVTNYTYNSQKEKGNHEDISKNSKCTSTKK